MHAVVRRTYVCAGVAGYTGIALSSWIGTPGSEPTTLVLIGRPPRPRLNNTSTNSTSSKSMSEGLSISHNSVTFIVFEAITTIDLNRPVPSSQEKLLPSVSPFSHLGPRPQSIHRQISLPPLTTILLPHLQHH